MSFLSKIFGGAQPKPQAPQPSKPRVNRNALMKAWDQLDFADGNRTFKQATPTKQGSAIHQLTHNGAINVSKGVLQPQINSISSGINVAKAGTGIVTGNKKATSNAIKGFKKNAQSQIDIGRQYFTKPLAEAVTSISPHQHTYHPGSRIEKALVGTAPIQNIQKKVANNYQTHSNLPKGARLGLAAAEAVGSLAQDVPAVGAVTKVGIKAGKAVAPELAKSGAVINKGLTPRVNVKDQATLRDFSDMHHGAYKPKPSDRSTLIAEARKVGDKYGVNLRSGTPEQLRNNANSVLDQIGMRNKQMVEGGYIGPEKVFENNPMSVENVLKQRERIAKEPKSNPIGSKTAELPVYDTKRVSRVAKAFRSTRSIIERQGKHGQELANRLQAMRDSHEIHLGELENAMPTVGKIASPKFIKTGVKDQWDNKTYENFVHATQGLEKPINAKVAQAVSEWQAVHPAIRQRAVDAGLDVGDLGPQYYPHFIDYDHVFKDKNTYNQAINHIVQTGQAKDAEEAIKLLGHARDVSRNREFGNLEASRLVDLPFYDKTPNSLISYLNGSTKRIAQTEHLGKGDEVAMKLIANAGLEGYDTEAMKNAFDVAVGAKKYSQTADEVSTGIRKYVTTTRLGLGALTNVSQNVNTGIVTGHLRTMTAALKQFSPKQRQFVHQTGVISDAVLNDLKGQQGYSSFSSKVFGKAVNKITAPGFGAVEKLNRSISATAGRDYALRLAQRGKEDTLRKLGVTGPINNKTLTEAQQVQAARKVVEKTQFKVDPQDLPGWTDSPGGKLVAQFRTFSYSQGKFVSNEILKPALKGNVVPLGRFLAALPVGYGLYETKRVIAGRPEEENPIKIGLQTGQNIGGAGLVFDLYNSINPIDSKYLPGDRRTSMTFGALGGPAVGVLAQAVSAGNDLVQRKNTPTDESRLEGKVVIGKNKDSYTDATPAARFGIQQIPVVGTGIKNRLLPFKKESNADAGKEGKPATPAQVAAAQKKTEDKSYHEAFKSKLSKDEQALSKFNKTERKSLIAQGKATQNQFDSVDKKIVALKKQYGQEVKTKEPTKTEKALAGHDDAIKLMNSIKDKSDTEKEAWRQTAVGPTGKRLLEEANARVKPVGLPDLPQNHATAEAYVKLLEKEATGDELEAHTARIAFLNKAYTSAFSQTASEVRGLSADKRKLALENNLITKDQMDEAVGMDNFFVRSGLSTPKVSKTFREDYGYGYAPAQVSIAPVANKVSVTARKHGVPENIFNALVKQESGGKQSARSPVGAIGLTQLMPETAKNMGVDPYNADQNLEGGAKYLKSLYDKFHSWPLAVAAYHGGPGAIGPNGEIYGPKTNAYVKSIMAMVKNGTGNISLALDEGSGSNQKTVKLSASSKSGSKKTALKIARAKLLKVRAAPKISIGKAPSFRRQKGYKRPTVGIRSNKGKLIKAKDA